MTPDSFIDKWSRSELGERQASQPHFEDLCRLLDELTPTEADPEGSIFCFERGATKATGGSGWADVWKKGHFGWEYKGPGKDLDAAYRQLLNYSVALENPPLLIVSDTKRIVVRTNWTNTVQQTYEIDLDDLRDGATRQILKDAFSNPEALRPKKTRQQLTEDAATEFAELAKGLRARGFNSQEVAHFVNRLVFCMFAEDVGLLPNHMFTRMLEQALKTPDDFEGDAETLFGAMKDGGKVGFENVEWFNGGLFDNTLALPLEKDEIRVALKVAKLDWSDIDPSILGTLFERGLDPDKRSQLGAHYTDREKIMLIVNPVVVDPLTKEWEQTRGLIREQIEKADMARQRRPRTQKEARRVHAAARRQEEGALRKARKLRAGFIERLRRFRVLDPACGSGNFLYLSLLALKDIEHRANLDAEALGLGRASPSVGPEALKGIEINPYAAELARVSVWIGEIQWMRRNGFDASRNPILRPLSNIECRDALIEFDTEAGEWRESEWPNADVIVGNPPFLGNKKMIDTLGEEYVVALRRTFRETLPGGVDLVVYWFDKSWRRINDGVVRKAGLVSTNSIRHGIDSKILVKLAKQNSIFCAWSDEAWVVEGADVRVSVVCIEKKASGFMLNGGSVERITSDLSDALFDNGDLKKLAQNAKASFVGVILNGPFEIDGKTARNWLSQPKNVNGRPNSDVIKRTLNGDDLLQGRPEKWVIDFGCEMSLDEAAMYELPFAYAEQNVLPYRQRLDEKGEFAVRAVSERKIWWRFARSRPNMRKFLAGLNRILVTPMVSSTRVFCFLDKSYLPDQKLVAFPFSDFVRFGILQSSIHELWTLKTCSWIGKGNDPTYANQSVFETFPFPEGLTPATEENALSENLYGRAIEKPAKSLNELRENWLNPADLVEIVSEPVEG